MRLNVLIFGVFGGVLIFVSTAKADAPAPSPGSETTGDPEAIRDEEDMEPITDPAYDTIVSGDRPPGPSLPEHRAGSKLSHEDMERRLPRSAPDALRYEPGVFVQQTAHGQGSAFIRGFTGQQTLLLFDGIRLNNGTYRQGPNQYFFTLDSQTIRSIQIVRGGASTRYGSDALGGVILALPMEAKLREIDSLKPFTATPHLIAKGASADKELGGRLQTNLTIGEPFGFFGGVGGRRVGMLESGGIVYNPSDGEPPLVPRFKEDNRTQLGTGFREFTADGRLVYRVAKRHYVKLAAYSYRQFDAPRTDQCPAAYAPYDECLTYDEQMRTLVYGAWEGEPKLAMIKNVRATLSWQRQHERRSLNRPSARVENTGRDDVDTFGLTLTGKTNKAQAASWLKLELSYGLETYYDLVDSNAWITFTDINVTQKRSRGQYLDDSSYIYGGMFLEGHAFLFHWLRLRSGGRFSWIGADAPADPESGSTQVSNSWFPFVGNGGVEIRATDWFHFLVNVDRSFRAPNLDDMTSRQQTGPGFQFENPSLKPETADTYEAGVRFLGPITAEFWGFWTLVKDGIVKAPRQDSDCPPNTPRCLASWSKFQLVNADDISQIRGFEASLLSEFPHGFFVSTTLSWTFGRGPNMGDPPADPTIPFKQQVPLSRIPPLNGTAELLWRHRSGFSTGATLRWAALQDRLALADISDARIPSGGTPGFAVFDLRATYRMRDILLVSLTFENVFDSAYRYHGSSVNGPGRGLMLLLDIGPLWKL